MEGRGGKAAGLIIKKSIAANIRSFLGISFRTVEKGHTGITHQNIILVRKTRNVLRQMTC